MEMIDRSTMKVIGICLAKDESDIIRTTVEHMLTQVDEVIVADNGSTDGTREILAGLPITLLDDPEVGHYQSRKTTNLAKVARNAGAEWVVPFDSDEIWYSPFGKIKDVLGELTPQWLVAPADLYDHVSTSLDDLSDANPVTRIGWRRRNPGMLPKVACRWREDLVIGEGNHGATYQGGSTIQPGLLVIRHFPYRSADQFCNKARKGAAAYAATDLPEEIGAHWRGYGAILKTFGEETLKGVYNEHFYSSDPANDLTLIYDPAFSAITFK